MLVQVSKAQKATSWRDFGGDAPPKLSPCVSQKPQEVRLAFFWHRCDTHDGLVSPFGDESMGPIRVESTIGTDVNEPAIPQSEFSFHEH